MRRQLFSIAPHGKFLEVLVDRILDSTLLGDWPREGPFWLSDVTIFLPTKRARLKLAEIFAARLGGAALLPDIRALGAEPGETEAPFLAPIDAPTMPEVADPLERRLTLARLVRSFAQGQGGFASPPNAAEIFRLADSLADLIDDLTIEGVDPKELRELVPEDLAGNWQDILSFLDVALKAWPGILAERSKVDGAAARNEQLRRQAATVELLYGDRPVIAAGSTGSIPATAALLKAITALPRGAIVLPGLDTSLGPAQHDRLLKGETMHGHPQYGLARLLHALGAGVAEVVELTGEAPRTALVRAAMAPAEETGGWASQRTGIDVGGALAGVEIIAAPNADMEARAIALAAREALRRAESVGIVSRDQTLARRIAAELLRHGIQVDDPAGTPLYQSSTGRLVRQALAAAVGRFAPVDVVALLRNRAVTLGHARADVQNLSIGLDLKLRRDRALPGLPGILALVTDEPTRALLDALGQALDPLSALVEAQSTDARQFARVLTATIDALIGEADFPGLLEFRRWAEDLMERQDAGPPFQPVNLDSVLAALMARSTVATGERRRDDIHIWGELEARLQNPDLLILAGFNEDIWPPAADPGPWMSRSMRMQIGLEPPERRQGQAAHDFEMALGNGRVILAYATRMGTAPALASRLVQRIDAFVGETEAEALRKRGARWLADAAAIDFAGVPRPASRPLPSPPADKRPRKLSVTEIETLMRSPYDIYAKHTLGLKKLEPLGSDPGARERGTMIHKVFERFVREGCNFSASDAAQTLLRMAEEEFRTLESISERRDIWLKRFARAAEQFLDWELARHGGIASRLAEAKGEWVFPALQGFVLSGKADRIDLRTDGSYEILDFKTGGVPQPKDMTAFEAPQLLLEAAMARAGVFPDIKPRDTAALTYIKIGLGPAAFQVRPFSLRKGTALMDAVGEIERRLQGHVEAFLIRDGLPLAARIRPRAESGRKPRPGDYDHLARTDEWTLTSGVDDP
jgi:ATP-dependent helicase/nuclease subunit B